MCHWCLDPDDNFLWLYLSLLLFEEKQFYSVQKIMQNDQIETQNSSLSWFSRPHLHTAVLPGNEKYWLTDVYITLNHLHHTQRGSYLQLFTVSGEIKSLLKLSIKMSHMSETPSFIEMFMWHQWRTACEIICDKSALLLNFYYYDIVILLCHYMFVFLWLLRKSKVYSFL